MTDGTVQASRAAARTALSGASGVLVGRPGLSFDAQLENLDKAVDLIEDALEAITEAREVVEERAENAASTSGQVGNAEVSDDLVQKIAAAVAAALKG